MNIKSLNILFLHSNVLPQAKHLHQNRVAAYNRLGYRVTLFDSTKYFQPTIFPYLREHWRKKDAALMSFYDALEPELRKCDVFIHFNGANIHPDFLEKFKCLKVYHCADDPAGSANLSKPVAKYYDVCAISNEACLGMYRSWGCQKVFFWPLGSSFPDETLQSFTGSTQVERDIPVVFVGSKFGVPSFRFFGKLLGLYKRRGFMSGLERRVPELVAYGPGWDKGFLEDEKLPLLYARSRLGVNKHVFVGAVNFRLYDLAAFGVMQICDHKKYLGRIFKLGEEVVGFDSLDECVKQIQYYGDHPDEARNIALAGQRRFYRDYSTVPLWERFIHDLETSLAE